MKSFYSVILSVFLTLPSMAFAVEKPLYVGGNFTFLDYSVEGVDDSSLGAISGRFGVKINEYISGEIRTGVGVIDESHTVLGVNVDVDLDYFFGAYVRGGFPVTKSFFPYAVLGYTRAEMAGSVPGFDVSGRFYDMSYGLGMDFNINKTFALNLEYMNYIDEDEAGVDVQLDGFAIGIVMHF